MDNVQKYNICTNVPSSQTFRSYLHLITVYSCAFQFVSLCTFTNGNSETVEEELFERLELGTKDWTACRYRRSTEFESNMSSNRRAVW
jgi:hypothetical protein